MVLQMDYDVGGNLKRFRFIFGSDHSTSCRCAALHNLINELRAEADPRLRLRDERAERGAVSARWLVSPALALVLDRLPLRERAAAAGVCRAWRCAAASPWLWRRVDAKPSRNPGRLLARLLSDERRAAGLEALNLEFCAGVVTGATLLQLAPARNLLELNLNGCRKVDEPRLCEALETLPKLERLELYWNTRVGTRALQAIAKNCPSLTYLNLSGCRGKIAPGGAPGDGSGRDGGVCDRGVEALAAKLRRLEFLDLTRCDALSDRSLCAVVRANCSSLITLNLYAQVEGVTDSMMSAIAQCPALTFLDLTGATKVTDTGLTRVARGCPRLSYLNMTWCNSLTDAGLIALGENCQGLGLLSLFGVLGVSDAGIEAIADSPSKDTLMALDVNGCLGVENRSKAELLHMFQQLVVFIIHS